MEEENEAILFAMVIGAVILGIGAAMFFNRPYTGYGAVVLAIGLMTLSLILTMRAEEIIHLKVYPTSARSENIAKVSLETPSEKEPTPQPYTETQTREALEPKEPYEVQIEQASETQEVRETEQPYTPSTYEPSPPQESETTTAQEPQETSFAEPEQEQEREQEPEPSIEAAPSSEQSQETEEPQEVQPRW